ncbi:hypothetical protein MMC25_001208 [Agyrium rufum]|nr:hypothetical protein [Agyrium rufum]
MDTTGIRPAMTPNSPIELASFLVNTDPDEMYYRTSITDFWSCVLKYTYLIDEYATDTTSWYWFITRRLGQMIQMQLGRYVQDGYSTTVDRINSIPHVHVCPSRIFNQPAEWQFYDDCMPGWYEEWRKTLGKRRTRVEMIRAKERDIKTANMTDAMFVDVLVAIEPSSMSCPKRKSCHDLPKLVSGTFWQRTGRAANTGLKTAEIIALQIR